MERQFAGKLSFHPRIGGMLDIVESHSSPSYRPAILETEIAAIHGYMGDHQFVTLLNCSWATAPSTFRGSEGQPTVSNTKLAVEYIILSHGTGDTTFYESIDDVMFDSVSVSYPYLSEWLTTPNLESLDQESHKYVKSGFEPASITLDNRDVAITFDDPIWIRSQSKLHLYKCLELIDIHIADFLTFTVGHANYPQDVAGYAGNNMVKVLYAVASFGEKVEEYITSYEMLFTFRDVRPILQDTLNRWITYREKLGAIYDLFLKPYYGRLTEFETAFLFLAQALEVFHRKEFPEKRHCGKGKFKEISKSLANAMPETVGENHCATPSKHHQRYGQLVLS